MNQIGLENTEVRQHIWDYFNSKICTKESTKHLDLPFMPFCLPICPQVKWVNITMCGHCGHNNRKNCNQMHPSKALTNSPNYSNYSLTLFNKTLTLKAWPALFLLQGSCIILNNIVQVVSMSITCINFEFNKHKMSAKKRNMLATKIVNCSIERAWTLGMAISVSKSVHHFGPDSTNLYIFWVDFYQIWTFVFPEGWT